MGLDMYLYLRKHESVGSWDENYENKKNGFYPTELAEFEKRISERNYLSKNTICQIGYWRKANAIHQWFVDNCADGQDDCRPVYVSIEDAEKLLKICKEVLATPDKAAELLHTQSGFFFGGTEYDEWYFEDIKYTVELLESVIEFVKSQETNLDCYWDILYEASW